ncbi:protein serine/threonine kinase [Heterostelium album PN500]|uniref:Protein serine/threonine kinase n=1 Tax=Heterostelium pallidum (strain ATCC 26659 / Pp 5 / PN500) TaxID=670386 RepID=D3BQ77_HETP5|nr:protein serine/threonine kinase [Heterostelium album PN500]EFA76297.1 protein serine/threonine kinase [Heterostelium album PN500]|eukprot:XP_020428429.1 protein serine/threonine kinase [Heterostelium album PN500]
MHGETTTSSLSSSSSTCGVVETNELDSGLTTPITSPALTMESGSFSDSDILTTSNTNNTTPILTGNSVSCCSNGKCTGGGTSVGQQDGAGQDTKSTITINETGSNNSIGDLLSSLATPPPTTVIPTTPDLSSGNPMTLDELLQANCREIHSYLYVGDLNAILTLTNLQLKDTQQIRCIGFDSSIEPQSKTQRHFQYQIIEFESETDILSITKQFDDLSQLILGRGRDTPCLIHECCFGLILASIYLIKYELFSLPQANDLIGYNDMYGTSQKHSHYQKVDSCTLIGDITSYYYRNMTKRRITSQQKEQQPQQPTPPVTPTKKKTSLLKKIFSSGGSGGSGNTAGNAKTNTGGSTSNTPSKSTKPNDNNDNDNNQQQHSPEVSEEAELPKFERDKKTQPDIVAVDYLSLPDQYKDIIKKWNVKHEDIVAHWEVTLSLLYFQTKVKFFPSEHQQREILTRKSTKKSLKTVTKKDSGSNIPSSSSPPLMSAGSPQQQSAPQLSSQLQTSTTSTSSASSLSSSDKEQTAKEKEKKDKTIPLDKRIASVTYTAYSKKSHDQLVKRSSSDFKKNYSIKERVGKGGFGSVYAARSNSAKGKVALKKLDHATSKDKKFNFKEIRVLDFCKHPNIITYHESYVLGDKAYISMEFMEGGTLSEASYQYPFQESNIAYVAQEILLGIHYLHTNQFVHRDLKSQNIMMTTGGDIKIIDFGLCTPLIKHSERTRMCGSPLWMPPEMILQRPHSYTADIWSLAVCLLELANRNHKLRKDPIKTMFMVGTEGIKEPFEDPNRWSDNFQDFISKCLRFTPSERPTALELLNHPFIQQADTKKKMGKILSSIFLKNIVGI